MAKITSVEPQKKNLHRFNIFLDGQFAFGADEDLVVNRRLVVGKEIASDDLDQILFEAEVGKIMEKMYRWFGIRQRTEREVRDYFKIKNQKLKIKNEEQISRIVIDVLIETLEKKKMINDEQFAKSWMEARSKKYGPNRIKQELFKKGIDRKIIEEVISQQSTANSSEEVAQELLEKKVERWKNLEPMNFRKKAYEYLLRRGFEYELVKSVVEKYLKKR